MPVDPSILHRYSPPEAPPTRRPDGLRALLVAVVGLAVIVAMFSIAWHIPSVAPIFVGAVVISNFLIALTLVLIGFREDGLIGVLYRLRHPLGTALGGDDRPPWTVWAVVLLYLVAMLLAGLLLVQHPEALPSWVNAPPLHESH